MFPADQERISDLRKRQKRRRGGQRLDHRKRMVMNEGRMTGWKVLTGHSENGVWTLGEMLMVSDWYELTALDG